MLDKYIDICKYINILNIQSNPMSEVYRLFKALSDKTRLEIAVYLAKKGEISCQELSRKFKLAQPTLSHHFGKLQEAGVISAEKRGVMNFYRVNRKFLEAHGVDLRKN